MCAVAQLDGKLHLSPANNFSSGREYFVGSDFGLQFLL